MGRKKEFQVIYIITKLELGGAQKICLSLYQGLKQHEIQTFLISGDEGLLVDKIKHHNTVCLLNTLKREISALSLLSELKTFIELVQSLRKLKKENPHTIVHTHSTKAGLLGRWAAWLAGIKHRVHTVHGYAFHPHQNKFVWSIIYFLELITSFITNHYICVSSYDVKTGLKFFPRFNKKHSIIRAAVEWELFNSKDYIPQAFPEQNKQFIFGTISCFKPQKNIFDLLKAFAVVHHKNPATRLEIIGDGHQRTTIEKWIRNHDLTHAILLHGWQDNVISFMKHWHAFTLSSLWEGLPCAIIEARLLKLPILSYDTGGIPDVVIPDQNGFLYEQKNWQALSQGMLKLSQDKELFVRLQNYQEDLSDFQDKNMIDQHRDLYQALI